MKTTNANHLRQMTKAEGLIVKFEQFGSNFNPPNANISLQALKDTLAFNKQLLIDIRENTNLLENYQNSKNKILEDVNLKVRQIEAIVTVIEVEERVLESVKTITANFKQRPKKGSTTTTSPLASNAPPVGTPSADASATEKTGSTHTAHRFAELRMEMLAQLVTYLESIPGYLPNEPHLSIESLKTYHEESTRELALWQREREKQEALRIKRNEQMLSPKTGLITNFRKALIYAKSVYEKDTNQYKELAGFVFTRR